MKKCPECGVYSLADSCKRCGGQTKTAEPPKYSPIDKYARYRRMMKRELRENQSRVNHKPENGLMTKEKMSHE